MPGKTTYKIVIKFNNELATVILKKDTLILLSKQF